MNSMLEVLLYDAMFLSDAGFVFRKCCEGGFDVIVAFMLRDDVIDPGDCRNYAIRLASTNGHLEVVRLLFSDKRVDPSDCDNYAVRRASENGHLKIVRLLLEDDRVDLIV